MTQWAIRIKDSGEFLKNPPYTPSSVCIYPTRKAANEDLKECIHQSRRDKYEVIKVRKKRKKGQQ